MCASLKDPQQHCSETTLERALGKGLCVPVDETSVCWVFSRPRGGLAL